MLTGVYQIGKYICSMRRDNWDLLTDIIEDASDGGKYKHILKITFHVDETNITYSGIEYEEYSNDKKNRYAYKSGPSKGGDYTPVSKFVDSKKTLDRIEWSLKGIVTTLNSYLENEKIIFNNILSLISAKKDTIQIDIEKKKRQISAKKNEGFILAICVINKDDECSYPGDFEIIKNRLIQISSEQYYSKYNKISKGTGICYYCFSTQEVYGFVNTFNSYTVDKPGMVTGGFKQENAWINYPVCSNCAKILEVGKRYILENLSSRFSGFNYMVIPKICINDNNIWEQVKEVLDLFERKTKFSNQKNDSNNLLSSEKDFIDIMKESSNVINYNILVFKEEQSGSVFRILLYIEDIVPSRVKQLIKVKQDIDKISLYHSLPGKDNSTYDLYFNFLYIREFFCNDKKEGNFDKSFLEILNNIFTFKPLSYKFILSRLVTKIRNFFADGNNVDVLVLKGLMFIHYLNKLNLIYDFPEGGEIVMPEVNDKNKIYIDFITEHKDVFNSDCRKAVFLTGVLVKKLLNIQYELRKSHPFYSRLNGLKLSLKSVEKLFTEAVNKLNEYDRNYYYALEELIAEYLLTDQKMSDDDVSFYFTLGLSLARKFKSDKEDIEYDNEQK